ncbi:MAG TPA: DNA methyltransferase [Ktedonobacterales bacterium]|nr:DNA methyltransferase [Ktedonobacterales bacterium]
MTLDKSTRNSLRLTVIACRKLLEEAAAELLEGQFGIHRDGAVESAAQMTHLSESDRLYREQVVRYLEHLASRSNSPADAVAQLIREVAFTHLNRLSAYKMLERRKLVRETVSRGLNSNGFKFYLADHPDDETLWSEGQQELAYRHFLDWTARRLGEEMPALFSEHDPANRLYPPQRLLDEVLDRLNDPALSAIWDEDETIGWIYQYFTPKELRDEARKASQAPRNSYELAFRNQFYTPRYVVEFLVDNTVGRVWWEMRQGQTSLASACKSMLHKQHPIWLRRGQREPEPFQPAFVAVLPPDGGDLWARPNSALTAIDAIMQYAITVDGYHYAERHLGRPGANQSGAEVLGELANGRAQDYFETGNITGAFEELRLCLFYEQRRSHHFGELPDGQMREYCQALYQAICEAWERDAEFVPYRKKRDPRELRILDPACGSGHFLLYCFDLLIRIYQEAWDDENIGPELRREFHDDFPAYQAAVPEMILRHNLHGIDIDLRAVQMAGLALWLRAQREYADLDLPRDHRPAIRRANLAYAEPMPGEYDLLRDFLNTLNPPALMAFVEDVWRQMRLAGEAGSLLQVEQALREKIAQAKRDWMRTGGNVQLTLFEQDKPPTQQMLSYTGVDDVTFYEKEAEPRVLDALKRFAENAPGDEADGYTRRLFAEDAERGFALIELLEKRYSVVLMNPPFGEPSLPSKQYIEKSYPRTKNDIYAAFVERGLQLLHDGGRLGAITSRTGFFLTSFQKWREEIVLGEARPVALADLGAGVLDSAMVETAAYVLERS